MIPSQRHLFDIPEHVTYLNCAYLSPLLRHAAAAGERGVRQKLRPWEITAEHFFVGAQSARTLFAQLINAKADDIAIVPAASYGIAVAARNLPLRGDQEIVVLADQFPSNVYAWRERARETGARIVTIERPADGDLSAAVVAAIGPRTAIVTLPHCHWTDGALLDLPAIGRQCRAVEAALVLDLSQSLGVLPFDVAEVAPDFITCATYKWLLGPYTLGFLYVHPKRQDGEPLEHSWIGRRGSENFAGLVEYEDVFAPGAQRFDMGERANFHLMPMAIAALEQLLDWGTAEIAATLAERTAYIAERAGLLGFEALPTTRRAGHFLGLTYPPGMPPEVLPALAHEHIHVSVRGSSMRVTPHVYNDDADADRLLDALARLL